MKVLGQIVALDRLIASVNIPASDAASIKTGQPAEMSSELASKAPTTSPSTKPTTAPAEMIGAVQLVSPIVDQKSDSVIVEIRLKPNAGLQPGQAVRVRIVTETHNDVLVVPAQSVIITEEGETVVSIVKDN